MLWKLGIFPWSLREFQEIQESFRKCAVLWGISARYRSVLHRDAIVRKPDSDRQLFGEHVGIETENWINGAAHCQWCSAL